MTTISGQLFIGNGRKRGGGAAFRGICAATGQALPGDFYAATDTDVDEAVSQAWEAFTTYRQIGVEMRAQFLERIATNIGTLGEELILLASAETGLPETRLRNELDRTKAQLFSFAEEILTERCLGVRIDRSDDQRKPNRKPDLRLRHIPLGPVAIFGASNFPLAFSVAGGDTASALAAGCTVIVKAHPAHPGTSELVGRAVQQAVFQCKLPAGTFGLLFDHGYAVGERLVADHRVRAVGFTGSRRGGLALMKLASERRVPIPVFAEMSSVNPVLIFPAALSNRAQNIAHSFVQAMSTGAGQFCTNPGLVFVVEGQGFEEFRNASAKAVSELPAQTMLTAGIRDVYSSGVERLSRHPAVRSIAHGLHSDGNQASASLFETTFSDFVAHPELQEEVFGASSLIVRCENVDDLRQAPQWLEGQLTVSVHAEREDFSELQPMIPLLEMIAGRLLLNGFGTGVEISPAMVHGGPFPATSDPRSTSVGTLSINRFLRPVCYQDFDQALLPEELSGEPTVADNSGETLPRYTSKLRW